MYHVELCAAPFVACAFAVAAQADLIVVPSQQPNIQAAINAASAGDTVLVLDGVYSGPGNHTIDLMGKSITLQSASGPGACTIDVGASSTDQRGAFFLHSGETSDTIIQGFTVTGGWLFNGPAMLLFNSSPTVRDCVFTENHADCWGGAVYFDSNAAPQFENCRFTDNFSADDGGAVFGFSGSPTFFSCLFADNVAPTLAGAILTWSSNHAPRLINCTVTGNHASFATAVYSNNLIIENSIIWGNTGGTEQIYSPTLGTVSVSYSNIEGGFAGEDNLNVLPGFADPLEGEYRLAAGSPCIDAGDPRSIVQDGVTDLDGDPRLFGPRIDMGFDEFRRAGDVTGDHIVNVNDLLAVIQAWGPCSWSLADLNHDFTVNVEDMLAVIADWG